MAQKSIRCKSTNRWPDRNSQYSVLEHERTIAINLNKFSEGDVFGEDLIFGFENRQYSVVAKETVHCFLMNRNDAIKYFHRDKEKLRERTRGLYVTLKELKSHYEEKARQKKVYDSIKRQAFGERYAERSKRVNGNDLKRKQPTDQCSYKERTQLPSIHRRRARGFDIVSSLYSEGVLAKQQGGRTSPLLPNIVPRAENSNQKENMNLRQINDSFRKDNQRGDDKSKKLADRLTARRNASKFPSIAKVSSKCDI